MATYTPNLNLKKPDYTDLADVADFNANMDIIDGLTQDDIPDGITNKAFTAAEKDKLAGIEAGANKTIITNNLTETEPGKALDATQGRELAEQISNIAGLSAKETVFNGDIITETKADGSILVTTFNADGTITEVLTKGTNVTTKLTTFNPDGSISEVIL